MNMKFYTMIALLVVSVMFAACGGTPETNTNTPAANTSAANTANANSTTAATNATDGVRRPDAPTANEAPTLKPIVLAYFEALRNKDDAAVVDVLTEEHVRQIREDLKERNRNDMAAFLAETEKLDATIEVRNEEITGDRAFVEVKGGVWTNWTSFGLRKENGKWKLSGESKDIQKVDGK